jgi:hypothetical protein
LTNYAKAVAGLARSPRAKLDREGHAYADRY